MFYIMEDIVKRYPQGLKTFMEKKISMDDEDYFMQPNNPRELLLPDHFTGFFMKYLKDLKIEAIEVMIHPTCVKFLKERKIDLDDLSDLRDEDLIRFKELFQANRVSKIHQNQGKNMEMLYDNVVDILSKRVPVENVETKVE